jgi:hypothetical protein
MLGHAKMIFEKGYVSNKPRHDNLINSLRTAVENEGVLNKEVTSHDDIFYAFRLALKKFYSYKNENENERDSMSQ